MHRSLAVFIIGCTVTIASSLAHAAGMGHPKHVAHGPADSGPTDSGPTYVTLQGAHRGSAAPVPVRPYAYGWFGAQPRYHCVRHFGYYRNYTQWTAR